MASASPSAAAARDSAPALTSITHAVSDAATPACARQTTPAFVK
jgi:hypothetical protein